MAEMASKIHSANGGVSASQALESFFLSASGAIGLWFLLSQPVLEHFKIFYTALIVIGQPWTAPRTVNSGLSLSFPHLFYSSIIELGYLNFDCCIGTVFELNYLEILYFQLSAYHHSHHSVFLDFLSHAPRM
jgi:hypothetical protein